ncbi:Lar family restriction alleviation protein [Pseudomonas sp. Eb3]|uniref:Lar family restriction alleviation protein n=1 Tax=Pseudomonas sp. Eb3 TaxID=1327558 RepID=UPI00210218C4|nr:Lar family restriction alleviation protein [Pseudomonas sp. Eb3]MCQ1993677.1 Lar family restriction alleviation protein [Pseudomonas sp. Eb3]
MPTENRSSNTEMVSELLPCPFCGEKPQITKHHREDIYSFMHRCPVLGPISWGFREDQQAHIEKWNARAQPAPQPHPEPIAWMVGTAFWWTKEEAERDAAATGLPLVGLGPMAGAAPAEQHQGEPAAWVRFRNGEPDYDGDACMIMNVPGDTLGDGDCWQPVYTHPAPADHGEVERLQLEIEKLRLSLTLNDDALIQDGFVRIENRSLRNRLAEQGKLLREIRGARDWNGSHWALGKRIDTALSASAGPNDECAHSYANGLGCPECGQTFDPKLIGIVHTPPAEYDEP